MKKSLIFGLIVGCLFCLPFWLLREIRRGIRDEVAKFKIEVAKIKSDMGKEVANFKDEIVRVASKEGTVIYKIKIVDAYNKGIYKTPSGLNSGFLEETIYTDGPTFALFAFSGDEGGTTVYVGHFEPTSRDSVKKATRDAMRNDGLLSAMSILSDMRRLPLDRVPLRDYNRFEDAKSKNDMWLKVTYHKVASRVEAISLEPHLNKDWVADAWKYYISQKNKS